MFDKASRSKLRFNTNRGQLSVEELWDLSLTSLDSIAKAVNKQIKDEGEESFLLNARKKSTTDNALRLDILKYIIGVREAEEQAGRDKAARQATIARLKEIATHNADEQLKSLSQEEILKQIAELEAVG